MLNTQMYKLGFELALQQAGLKEAGLVRDFGNFMWRETPTFRRMLGLGGEMGHEVMNPTLAKNIAQKYKNYRPPVPTPTVSRPALARNLAAQPRNAYAVR